MCGHLLPPFEICVITMTLFSLMFCCLYPYVLIWGLVFDGPPCRRLWKNLQAGQCGNQIGAKVIQLIVSTSCVIFIFRYQHKKIMDSGVYLQNHVSDFFENKKHVLCEIKTGFLKTLWMISKMASIENKLSCAISQDAIFLFFVSNWIIIMLDLRFAWFMSFSKNLIWDRHNLFEGEAYLMIMIINFP